MGNVVSFDTEKAARYLRGSLDGFLKDAPDTEYQQGYLAAMLDVHREALGKGSGDDRLALLDAMVRAPVA